MELLRPRRLHLVNLLPLQPCQTPHTFYTCAASIAEHTSASGNACLFACGDQMKNQNLESCFVPIIFYLRYSIRSFTQRYFHPAHKSVTCNHKNVYYVESIVEIRISITSVCMYFIDCINIQTSYKWCRSNKHIIWQNFIQRKSFKSNEF